MGFLNWISDKGSIGSTAKWAIKGYNELKSKDEKKSDLKIFEEMIKIRYLAMPNADHENHLLSNVKNLPGLAGLVIEILNVEAGLSSNVSGDDMDHMVKPIFERLEETNLSDKTKYGEIGPPVGPLTGAPVKIDSKYWHHGVGWNEFIYTHSQRKI